MVFNYLNRPEYIFNPIQIYRRLSRPKNQQLSDWQIVNLPWGFPLKIRSSVEEVIERSLWVMGIYDLSLTETIWRLVDPGATVLDIGANIGYITSLFAAKVGLTGKVISFEPNPEVYAELQENVKLWQLERDCNFIELQPLALSNQTGSGILKIPPRNRGEAALIPPTPNNGSLGIAALNEDGIKTYSVPLEKLANILDKKTKIGLLKIDVEGHELAVFQGAEHLLKNNQIRDIVFEEHQPYPSLATDYLEAQGYQIFRLWKGFFKPYLKSPQSNPSHPWEPPNYLATLESERAIERFQAWGWFCLHH